MSAGPSGAAPSGFMLDLQRGWRDRPEMMTAFNLESARTHNAIRCMTKEDGHAPSGTKSFWGCCASRPRGVLADGQHLPCNFLFKGCKQQSSNRWFVSPKTAQGPPIVVHSVGCPSAPNLSWRQLALHPALVAEQAKSKERLPIKTKTLLSQVFLEPAAG